MNIFNYRLVTGEFVGSSAADPDPMLDGEFLIPAFSTTVEPPDQQAGWARVWSGSAWEQVLDHRGETWWGPDGNPVVIEELGNPVDSGLWSSAPLPTPDFDPRAQTPSGEFSLAVDAQTKRVTATPIIRDLTAEEIAALPPIPVPDAITMRQARLVLLSKGLLANVDTTIDGLTEPQRSVARIEWEYALELKRAHPLVAAMQASMDLTDAQVDAMFIAGAAIA
jgi:hypothetical protein